MSTDAALAVFSCRPEHAESVYVAGTFNGWNPKATPMKRDSKGDWTASLPLPSGRYEYKFVIDGDWCCEPGCTRRELCSKCVPNKFGTMNRVLEVEA
jgi:hypothetical protein